MCRTEQTARGSSLNPWPLPNSFLIFHSSQFLRFYHLALCLLRQGFFTGPWLSRNSLYRLTLNSEIAEPLRTGIKGVHCQAWPSCTSSPLPITATMDETTTASAFQPLYNHNPPDYDFSKVKPKSHPLLLCPNKQTKRPTSLRSTVEAEPYPGSPTESHSKHQGYTVLT